MKYVLAVASATLLASAAQATTVYNTSLPAVNGTYGTGVATTTTGPTGTLTTVVGTGGSANRANATPVANQWEQENVGGNASVGITTTYARSGNGSAFFQALTPNDSKADLEYYFSTPVSLSSVSTMSYDWYRSSTSTTAANQVNSLRLLVTNGAKYSNLIFEPVYNGVPVAPTDSWQTSSITTASTFWSSNNNLTLPAGVAACPSCFTSLANWQSSNPGWSVYGLSTGIGSGWSGTYTGAVDNIAYNFGAAGSNSFNFEVAAAVPEPATWGMMLLGFGLIGAAIRRRQGAIALA